MGWNCCHCSAYNRGLSESKGAPCQNARVTPHCPHLLCAKCEPGVIGPEFKIEKKHTRRHEKETKEGAKCTVM